MVLKNKTKGKKIPVNTAIFSEEKPRLAEKRESKIYRDFTKNKTEISVNYRDIPALVVIGIDFIKKMIAKNVIILNCTQCYSGSVTMGKYETSIQLKDAGVISGGDMTTEAAVTKMMFLLNKDENLDQIEQLFEKDFCGEISIAKP